MDENTNFKNDFRERVNKEKKHFWFSRLLIWLPTLAALGLSITISHLEVTQRFVLTCSFLAVIALIYNVWTDWNHQKNLWKIALREHLTKDRLKSLEQATAKALARMSLSRERRENDRSDKLGRLSVILAQEMSKRDEFEDYLDQRYLRDLSIAAPLHDIGRLALPDRLLKEEGDLNMGDFERLKSHVLYGGDLLAELQKILPWRAFFRLSKEICYHHHQRWDGNGYPNVMEDENGNQHYFVKEGVGKPLAAEAIPLSARIVAVADNYLALTSSRPWRKAFSHSEALSMIRKDSGLKFDPRVVESLLAAEKEIKVLH